MAVKAVFFDVGETLLDETRLWESWADAVDVPRFTFLATLGGVIARGEDHRRVFELLRPDLTDDELFAKRNGAQPFGPDDLYPDVLPCLEELRVRGYRLGAAGNTTTEVEDALRRCGFEFDAIGSSEGWQVWKPSPVFFARVVEAAGCESHEVVYVGDRVDNDIVPAATAGLLPVFIRRGPWAVLHGDRPEAGVARARIESLRELSEVLHGL
jgi:HAD superfamily hydrolase (TIGR01549 family)